MDPTPSELEREPKMNADEKNPVGEPEALTDEQLDETSGGFAESIIFAADKLVYSDKGIVGFYQHDMFGGACTLKYWPCSKCGKPMHRGDLNHVYCDPCNHWQSGDRLLAKEYPNSVDELTSTAV
jgi:hypothetical protein